MELEAGFFFFFRDHNKKLMEACRDLKDYAEYVDRIRRYTKETDLEEAVERTITECIQEGILKEFLEKNRAEVKKVSIYEYDREEHIRMEKQESWEGGLQAGILQGEEKLLCKMIRKKLEKGKTISQIAEELEEEEEKIQELIAAHDLDSI